MSLHKRIVSFTSTCGQLWSLSFQWMDPNQLLVQIETPFFVQTPLNLNTLPLYSHYSNEFFHVLIDLLWRLSFCFIPFLSTLIAFHKNSLNSYSTLKISMKFHFTYSLELFASVDFLWIRNGEHFRVTHSAFLLKRDGMRYASSNIDTRTYHLHALWNVSNGWQVRSS